MANHCMFIIRKLSTVAELEANDFGYMLEYAVPEEVYGYHLIDAGLPWKTDVELSALKQAQVEVIVNIDKRIHKTVIAAYEVIPGFEYLAHEAVVENEAL